MTIIRSKVKLFHKFVFLFLLGICVTLYNVSAPKSSPVRSQTILGPNTKLILFFTAFFGRQPYPYFYPHADYSKACDCNFTNCKISYNKYDFTISHAVVFHARDMPSVKELEELNAKRIDSQRWIYFVLENPMFAPNVVNIERFFNWSMSYRLNSDIRFPYGRSERLETPNTSIHTNKTIGYLNKIFSSRAPVIQRIEMQDKTHAPVEYWNTTNNYSTGKSKQIAWLSSHDIPLREDLIHKLKENGIKIDVEGTVSYKFKSPLHCKSKDCLTELKEYKFYYAAENGVCEDYITEKYWKIPFLINAIPIVFGGAEYKNEDLAIPFSYINPLDFKNVKHLASYIKQIDGNDTLFNEYFKWKENWRILPKEKGCDRSLCDLCQKLQRNDDSVHRPLSQYINTNKECVHSTNKYRNWMKK